MSETPKLTARAARALAALQEAADRRRQYLTATKDERARIVAAFKANVPRKAILEASSLSAKEVSNIQKREGLRRVDRQAEAS